MIICYIFILLEIAAISVNAGVIDSIQSVTVIGKLMCGTKSVRDVEVQLWDEDTDDPDNLLNTTYSDAKGAFEVYGEDDATEIEPYLVIKHNCNNSIINPKCTITDAYPIPKKFIGKVYNMYIVSLNIIGRNHKKDCKLLINEILKLMINETTDDRLINETIEIDDDM
ncbi:unnamed protein product [Onchocerca flexuosa]|uniref:Transthyretin-like family protein n=1 Tax=Onchocerca flexuosa TaxID=387005 RepID=A0A183HIY5_9BILA|nr:unnamed protein product [Onchocerca flexuosa]